MGLGSLLQEAHHQHVVVEVGGRSDDLIDIRRDLLHLSEGVVEFPSMFEIMVRKDQASMISNLRKVRWLHSGGTLKFYVHQVTSGGSGLHQHFDLRSHRPFELPSIHGATASPDGGDIGMRSE